jgi:hypothetical protein
VFSVRRRFFYPCADIVTEFPGFDRALDRLASVAGANPARPTLDVDDPVRTVVALGFPRSGNTLLTYWLRWSAAVSTTVLDGRLTHSALDVHRLAATGAAVIIPVRNPLDTAASWMVRANDYASIDFAARTLRSHAAWSRMVAKAAARHDVLMVDFETLIADPSIVGTWQRLDGLLTSDSSGEGSEFESWMRSELEDVPGQGLPEGGTPAHQMISLPHADRLPLLEQAGEVINRPELAGARLRALDAHDALLAQSVSAGNLLIRQAAGRESA